MNLGDLLALLREEFSNEIPAVCQAIDDAVHQPDQAPVLLEKVVDHIERSVQTGTLIQLHGWGSFLSLVAERTQMLMMEPDIAGLRWLMDWTTPALLYLEAPAEPQAVRCIVDYLMADPQGPDTERVDSLVPGLIVPPALSEEDRAASEALVEDATEADVGLAVDDVDGDLLSAMLADAPQELERLASTLQSLAAGQADAAMLVEAQRIAHTFKGSGNIIGLPAIGRISHRLEDVLEWAVAGLERAETCNPAAVQDMLHAVGLLQQMVAHLLGEEEAPAGALECLQRLIDWVNWIRRGTAREENPPPLSVAVVANEAAAAPAGAGSAERPGTDVQTLRIGVDRLGRVLRRATQAIVASQRATQLARVAQDRLASVESTHVELERRLRELEQLVGRQVVRLQEQREAGSGIDPLEMDRYDALYSLSRSIAESVQDEMELARQAREQVLAFQRLIHDEGQLQREQHRDLLAARLVPVKTLLPRLKRIVAQTAASTGKKVRLLVDGDSTTLDAEVLTRLTEPLLHLLRNAIDHGLETPQDRLQMGKPDTGTVSLSFRRVGQDIELICADDGAGLDLGAIYAKAVDDGMVSPGTALTDAEIRRLILRAGFSTRAAVTEVSGRGVGMDVVNDRVIGLKGQLDIDSTRSAGTRFTVRVPVSTGAVQALIVACAHEEVALSAEQVVQALSPDEFTMTLQGDGQPVLHHLDAQYPAHSLAAWLGWDEPAPAALQGKAAVLCRGADRTLALLVDAAVDARELVLQDVGRLARRVAGVVGATLRNDGRPMFLIDTAALDRAHAGAKRVRASAAVRRRAVLQRTRVLVVDDALSVRRSMQQLLEDAGYEVHTASDGFQALDAVRQRPPAIVLTDLEMPNLNGLELTMRLRERPESTRLPVVMITSRASDKHRELAAAAGVDLYLTKPYTDAALVESVRTLTSRVDRQAMLDTGVPVAG